LEASLERDVSWDVSLYMPDGDISFQANVSTSDNLYTDQRLVLTSVLPEKATVKLTTRQLSTHQACQYTCLARSVSTAGFVTSMEDRVTVTYRAPLLADIIPILQEDHRLLREISGLDIQNVTDELSQSDESLKSELSYLSGDVEAMRGDLANTKEDLEDNERRLNETREYLSGTQAQLGEVAYKLEDTRWELNETREELMDTQLELEDLKHQYCVDSSPCGGLTLTDTHTAVVQVKGQGVEVMCDTDTDGGRWVVIQRRVNGNVSFYQDWEAYKQGFGELSGDFWLGLETVHQLTTGDDYYEMRFDFTYDNTSYYAQYDTAAVMSESEEFTLYMDSYQGNAGDDMDYQNGWAFTTYDRDNSRNGDCTSRGFGISGFWFNNCFYVNLNGNWGSGSFSAGVNWFSVTGLYNSATFTEMKIRRKC